MDGPQEINGLLRVDADAAAKHAAEFALVKGRPRKIDWRRNLMQRQKNSGHDLSKSF